MERNDLPEVLFEKMNEIVDYYPIQVKSVEGMLVKQDFSQDVGDCGSKFHQMSFLVYLYWDMILVI